MPKSFTKLSLNDYLKRIGSATIVTLVVFLPVFTFVTPHCAFAADKETNGSGGVHEVVAELSDEQVRRLLIEELQKTGSYSEDEGTGLISKGIFSGMLARLENLTGTLYWRISALHFNYVKIPHDIAKAVDYFTEGKGILHFGKMLGILLVIFAASFGVEKFIGKFTYNKSRWFEIVPSISGLAKLWGAVLKTLPSLSSFLTTQTSIRFGKQLRRSAKKCLMIRRWVLILSNRSNQPVSEKWVIR